MDKGWHKQALNLNSSRTDFNYFNFPPITYEYSGAIFSLAGLQRSLFSNTSIQLSLLQFPQVNSYSQVLQLSPLHLQLLQPSAFKLSSSFYLSLSTKSQ
ncbi:unnamed protein product [Hymenolepis diminuta]|uniref:Uncharacterized protein n=1 Tax=Hymenolepis diminuta TaxID=6216 RepID=A0A564Y3S5_HYMDI|nr:unnamed protein product [Hymenolepis diminuta]